MIIFAFRLNNIMGSKKCLSSNTDSQRSSRGRALALSRNHGRKGSDPILIALITAPVIKKWDLSI